MKRKNEKKKKGKLGLNHFIIGVENHSHFSRSHYLIPKHSIISPVSVDLFLLLKVSEAAFLSKADPAMHPITVGFFGLVLTHTFENRQLSIQRQD